MQLSRVFSTLSALAVCDRSLVKQFCEFRPKTFDRAFSLCVRNNTDVDSVAKWFKQRIRHAFRSTDSTVVVGRGISLNGSHCLFPPCEMITALAVETLSVSVLAWDCLNRRPDSVGTLVLAAVSV